LKIQDVGGHLENQKIVICLQLFDWILLPSAVLYGTVQLSNQSVALIDDQWLTEQQFQ